jgi:NAD(P)H dehydrogenase (quinone)
MKQLVILCQLKNEKLKEEVWSNLIQFYEKYKLDITVRNLNELGFNPVMSDEDITAAQQGTVLDDVKTEQNYIADSDCLVFVYSIFPSGMPALLKGYIDRVFSEGFAYSFSENGEIIKLLKKKKVVLINLVDHQSKLYKNDLINNLTSCEKYVFESFGMEIFNQFFLEIPNDKIESNFLETKLEDLRQEIKRTMILSRNSRLSIPTAFW